jgi:phosphoglycolate phosphatase
MPYKAVLFDLDGTLLDTLEDLGNASNRVLQSQGFPTHPINAYRYFVGDGAKTLIHRILPENQRNEEMIERCLNIFREDYGQNWNIRTRPYDGVPEMLDTLQAKELKLSILTNKPHEFTIHCVSSLLPDWHFDIVYGQRDGVPRKPDPAGAIEIAENLHIPPEEFLYLGDTGTDMRTAVAAGMHPVGVLWGFRQKKELEENGAQVLIEHPSEFIGIL